MASLCVTSVQTVASTMLDGGSWNHEEDIPNRWEVQKRWCKMHNLFALPPNWMSIYKKAEELARYQLNQLDKEEIEDADLYLPLDGSWNKKTTFLPLAVTSVKSSVVTGKRPKRKRGKDSGGVLSNDQEATHQPTQPSQPSQPLTLTAVATAAVDDNKQAQSWHSFRNCGVQWMSWKYQKQMRGNVIRLGRINATVNTEEGQFYVPYACMEKLSSPVQLSNQPNANARETSKRLRLDKKQRQSFLNCGVQWTNEKLKKKRQGNVIRLGPVNAVVETNDGDFRVPYQLLKKLPSTVLLKNNGWGSLPDPELMNYSTVSFTSR